MQPASPHTLIPTFACLTLHDAPTLAKPNSEQINTMVKNYELSAFSMVKKEKVVGLPISIQFALHSRLHTLVREGLIGYPEGVKQQIKKALTAVSTVLGPYKKELLLQNLVAKDDVTREKMIVISPVLMSSSELFTHLREGYNYSNVKILYTFTMNWLEHYKGSHDAWSSEEALRQFLEAIAELLTQDETEALTKKINEAVMPQAIPTCTIYKEELFCSVSTTKIEEVAAAFFQIKQELLLQFREGFLLAPHWLFVLLPYMEVCKKMIKLVKNSIRNERSPEAQETQIARLYQLAECCLRLGDYSSATLIGNTLQQFPTSLVVNQKKEAFSKDLNWETLTKDVLEGKVRIPPLHEFYDAIQSRMARPTLLCNGDMIRYNSRPLEEIVILTKLLSDCKSNATRSR